MPSFADPDPRFHASFLAAMAEFAAEGRGSPDDDSVVGDELRTWSARWQHPEVFAEFTTGLVAERFEDTPRPAGRVPCTTLWWSDGDEYLGRLAIRHRLAERLREHGGHIGYDVRPSARRRGHATTMLRTALPIARGLGIDRALLTCDVGNVGSRKVIEANGGALEGERHGMRFYWVAT